MKITINKKDLSAALANAYKITRKSRSSIEITSSVLIEAFEGAVRISASNLDQTYQRDLQADVQEPGKAALPCENLKEIVSTYPEPEITINETHNRWFRIGSENGPEYHLVGSDTDNFPEIAPKYGESVEMDGEMFNRIVRKTCFIQSHDDQRAHIKGVLFSGNEEGLKIYSTDGAMISRYLSDKIGFSGNHLISKAGLSSISVGDKVSICFSESTAFFETDSGIWGIRLLEGDYPDADGLFKAYDPPISFAAHDIIDLLKRAKTMNTEAHKAITLEFKGNKLTAQINNPDIGGEFTEIIDIDSDIDIKVAVDTRLLFSIVNISDDDSMMEFYGQKKPVIVLDGDFTFAVMPMSL